MTIRKKPDILFCLACLVVMYAAGCGRSPSGDKKSDQSVWTPDPDLAKQLKQTGEVGDYRLSVPVQFTAVELPVKMPANMTAATWMGKAKPGELPPLLSVIVTSDQQMVNEATQNMRQSLVNFSAGWSSTSGIQITTRERTESGALGGIPFSRFRWSGTKTDDGTVVRGVVYGAVDNGRSIAIIGMNFGPNADTENKLLETAIATFRKR
jgi:hypothetical protein